MSARSFGPTPARKVVDARRALAEAVELGADADVRECLRLVDEWLSVRPASTKRDLVWYFGAERMALIFGTEATV